MSTNLVWFEIPGSDTGRARAFYSGLFGWAEDVDASVAKVKELGGTATEAQEVPGVGRMAVCQDDQGATFGLYEPAQA